MFPLLGNARTIRVVIHVITVVVVVTEVVTAMFHYTAVRGPWTGAEILRGRQKRIVVIRVVRRVSSFPVTVVLVASR